MTTGITDLFESERGVFAILIVIAATVLVVMGVLGADSWIDLVKWIGGALIVSKTVTTAVTTVTDGKKASPS